MNTNTFVRPSFDGKIFIGVEVNVGGEHFLIAPHDLGDEDGAWDENWYDTMKILEQTNNKIFTYKQICATMICREEINTILKENGGDPLDGCYWTCADESTWAFYYDGSFGRAYLDGKDDGTCSCRVVLTY